MSAAGAYLLGALGAAADRVVAWIGTTDRPSGALELIVGDARQQVAGGWTEFDTRGGGVRAQRVTIEGLASGRDYAMQLVVDHALVATASVSTLPAALPLSDERPFTVLLGSCFSVAQDPAGQAGASIARLPVFAKPHVAIYAGDQVYLDSPFLHFLTAFHSEDDLAEELLSRYMTTWTQRTAIGGFQQALTTAGACFTSDDHDYWNNAPLPAPYVLDTWTAAGRAIWRDQATRLFKLFGGIDAPARFAVGPLSFFVADTRISRTEDDVAFMTGDQLGALEAWVRGLSGPGVLVTGQPIFAAERGFVGRFTDYGLPDYRQFGDLARILLSTGHDIVVLTGDVHYGRVAISDLPAGSRLIEVIASPFALVSPLAAGKWGAAPMMFPAGPLPGVARPTVTTAAYRRDDEHFITAAFTGAGQAVQMSVTAWPVRGGNEPTGAPVLTTVLH